MLKYFLWTAFEKLGSQIINLLVQILLARILAPEIFGLIALIQIFIAVAQVIVEAGIGNYIIQKGFFMNFFRFKCPVILNYVMKHGGY